MTIYDNAVRLFPVEEFTIDTAPDHHTIIDQIRAERGRELMQAAEEWKRLNPRMFSWIEQHVLNAAEHGRKTSIRELCERIRWADNVNEEGNPVRISNSITAALARIIVREHPEVREHLQLNRSVCDYAEELA